jgi:hypothetical protein
MTHLDENHPPVLIIGFARLANVAEIAERILRKKPCCLFVQVDGGRYKPNSQEVRNMSLTLSGLNLGETEIHIFVERDNLGIAKNLSKGVGRALADHPSVIVLEDDCYPAPVFYEFMAAALRLHKDHLQIGMISGNAYIRYRNGPLFAEVSNVPQTWGWATWRDRWEGFDVELSKFTRQERSKAISSYSSNPFVRSHWRERVAESINDKNMWDAQWSVYMWLRRYQCINPSENLVKNSGIDQSATHTVEGSIFSDWENSDRRYLTKEVIQAIATPRAWNWTRRLQHEALLRLSLVSSLVERWRPDGSRSVARKLASILARRRHPNHKV